MKRSIILVLLLILVSGAALAQDRWLHIRVKDFDGADDFISINMPLSAVERMLAGSELGDLRKGKLHLDDDVDIDGIELREVLLALRDAPDSEFITIRSRRDNVRVAKEDGYLLINVDERNGDRVRLRMPMEVVDVLIEADDDDEVDVARLFDALAVLDGTDLITVESDDTNVRIWIDSYSDGD
jgi:hypothetical protein